LRNATLSILIVNILYITHLHIYHMYTCCLRVIHNSMQYTNTYVC